MSSACAIPPVNSKCRCNSVLSNLHESACPSTPFMRRSLHVLDISSFRSILTLFVVVIHSAFLQLVVSVGACGSCCSFDLQLQTQFTVSGMCCFRSFQVLRLHQRSSPMSSLSILVVRKISNNCLTSFLLTYGITSRRSSVSNNSVLAFCCNVCNARFTCICCSHTVPSCSGPRTRQISRPAWLMLFMYAPFAVLDVVPMPAIIS